MEDPINKSLVGIGVVVYLAGAVAIAGPPQQTAQPQEKPGGPTSGARLSFEEKSRNASPNGEFITYALRANGLPQSKSYSLIGKWMNGKTARVPGDFHIDQSGRVLRKDGGELDLVLGGTFPGEFIQFALVSEDGAAKGSVEITPVPIQAVGQGGCRLSVKPLSAKGEMFSITGEGFKPNEQIKGVGRSSGEVMDAHLDNKGGNLKLVVFPAVVGKTGGEASLTASDSSCSVTVHYAWGDAMMKLSPTANRAVPDAQPTPATTLLPTPLQIDAQPTPQLSKGAQQLGLATRVVNLDYKIALVNVILLHVTTSIFLGKEEINHENAKDYLERFQRERRALTDEIDREGFINIAGEYDWQPGTPGECKLKELPANASGPVTAYRKKAPK